MSERHRRTAAGERTSRVSLAVRLVDAYTTGRPVGSPRVRIEGVDATPVENSSGYHVFLDLEPATVTVRAEGGERYLDARRDDVQVVDPSDPTPDDDPSDAEPTPLVELPLAPSPAYSFPPGATRIRGRVRGPSGDGVAGAELTLRALDRSAGSASDDARPSGRGPPRRRRGSAGSADDDAPTIERSTVTNERGEFVLFFAASDSPAVTGDAKRIEGPDGDPTIEVTHPEFGSASETVAVAEGELAVHDVEYEQ